MGKENFCFFYRKKAFHISHESFYKESQVFWHRSFYCFTPSFYYTVPAIRLQHFGSYSCRSSDLTGSSWHLCLHKEKAQKGSVVYCTQKHCHTFNFRSSIASFDPSSYSYILLFIRKYIQHVRYRHESIYVGRTVKI